jgi:putative DNA primase/helicase
MLIAGIEVEKPAVTEGHNRTDAGNAARFVEQWSGGVKYVRRERRWYLFDGKRWVPDQVGAHVEFAKLTSQSIYTEAMTAGDLKTKEALAKFAARSEAEPSIKRMLDLAASDPAIALRGDEFDADPWLMNVANGTVDLRSSELRPHRAEDLISKLAPVTRDPAAKGRLWTKFLESILPPDVIEYVQRAAGYSLTGLTSEQVYLVLYGAGSNGKSVFVRTLHGVLGDYAVATPVDTLLVQRGSAIPNDIARLVGARLITCSETPESGQLAEARVNAFTGQAPVTARFMRGEWFEFEPVGKLWLETNHRPLIRDTSHATWRRIVPIPFTVTIPDEEQDRELGERLLEEAPAILEWMLAGCRAWQDKDGDLKRMPDVMAEAKSEYREALDFIGGFIDEECQPNKGMTAIGILYHRFKFFADEGGYPKMSQRAFGDRLVERGYARCRFGKHRVWMIEGLGLKNPATGQKSFLRARKPAEERWTNPTAGQRRITKVRRRPRRRT